MLKRALRMVHYAGLLLRIGGLRVFLSQLRRQIYSRDILFGLEKSLDNQCVQISSKLPHFLRQASKKDMEELLAKAKEESKESVHELVERIWFYECGFNDCYVARNADTGELCSVAWLISANDGKLVDQGFKNRLPRLEEDELLLENCYTFEKYRGNSIMPSVIGELQGMARGKGFQRLTTCVRQDNVASLRAFRKLAFRKFEEIHELKILFFTKRKHENCNLLDRG